MKWSGPWPLLTSEDHCAPQNNDELENIYKLEVYSVNIKGSFRKHEGLVTKRVFLYRLGENTPQGLRRGGVKT